MDDRNREDAGTEVIDKFSTRKKLIPLNFLKSVHCCVMLCLSLCANSLLEDMNSLRYFFGSFSRQEQKQWLLDYLWLHKSENHTCTEFLYLIGNQIVCQQAWIIVLGVPQSSFYKIRKLVKEKIKVIPMFGSRIDTMATKTYASIAWLSTFARRFGDQLPDTTTIQLPMCVTRKTIYELMKTDLADMNEECISYSHFMKIWRTSMKYIAIPKVSKFSKCDQCIQYKLDISKTRTREERELIKTNRDIHLNKQKAQRQKYYKHIIKAKKSPEHYISIIIDGMDQNKTSVPHMPMCAKSINQMWKLRVHLTGVIVHGKMVYGYFDYNQIQHNGNLTINVLLDVLMSMEKIPDTLYLQMDNCGRENKNRYVLGFLSLLVRMGIFRKIKVSFLMVGHTHEDIDRTFSSFSKKLNRNSAMTLEELMTTWSQSQCMPTQSKILNNLHNISEWLAPCLANIEGHSKPHAFKISKDSNGDVVIQWKEWATDSSWNNIAGQGVLLIRQPAGQPHPSPTNNEKINVTRLNADLEKITSFMTTG